MMSQKIVICGAGFLGFNIAKAIASAQSPSNVLRCVQVSSRQPERVHASLTKVVDNTRLLPPVVADVTNAAAVASAVQGAHVVVSLVGIMHGTLTDFEEIQWKGAANVARAAKDAGAKLIHVSAIGADANSKIPYARTKALGEHAALDICPNATVIRPSIVFGPGDDFFNKFARLSRILPFLPVFGGGHSKFQPVFVGDIARAVEIISRADREIRGLVEGKTIEAGGPDIFTYREMMQIILQYTHRRRMILSIPFGVGMLQGAILERLPVNLFTVTRAQVQQLKLDNVVTQPMPENHVSFKDLVENESGYPLQSVHDILPTYL